MAALFKTKTVNAIFAFIAAGIIVAFLLSYTATGTLPTITTNSQLQKQPEFFLTNASNTHYDQRGRLDLILTAEEINHIPANDSVNIKEPELVMYRDGLHTWTITAQSGTVFQSGQRVELEQRVLATSSDQESIVKTPQLTVFPDKKLVKTNKPVTLLNPNGFTRSIGLKADLKTKKIDLLEHVRGQYQGVNNEDES